ncbi:MAG: S8 family serine peptidase [Polyangiaceae bacterium]
MSERTPQIVAAAGIVAGLALVGGGAVLLRKTPGPKPAPSTSASAPESDATAAPTFSPSPTAPGSTPSVEELSKQYPSLAKLAEDPRVASVLKEFAIAYEKGGLEGARAYAVEHGFMNSMGDATLTILVDDGADVKTLINDLKGAGAQIQAKRDGEIDIIIPFALLQQTVASGKAPEEVLRKLAATKGVRGVLPQMGHHPNQVGGLSSEGVKQTRADKWHAAGFKGAGIKVGILDPEVSKADKFIGKTLPSGTPVYTAGCVGPGGRSIDDEGIHGVAAAEIVHEMAPDAQLFLACSKGDEDASIDWLLKQGVKIIFVFCERNVRPQDEQVLFQKRIDQLAAQGILWVNSSGNEGKAFHRGTLEGGASGTWHQFGPNKTSMGFKVSRKNTLRITLIWKQWGDLSISDYDLYVLDRTGKELARSQDKNAWLRRPQEQIVGSFGAGEYYVGVRANGSAKSAPFILNIDGAESIELPVPTGSLGAPADAKGAFTVGAVVWRTDVLAAYSSQGPTEDGRMKPEISAPTETSSQVYGGVFGGTSSSCPHVSGAAAVLWSRFPNYSRDDIARFLTSKSKDLGPAGPDNMYGSGRLDLGDPGAAGTTPTAPATGTAVAPTSPTSKPTATGKPTATPTATATATSPAKPTPGTSTDDSSGLVGAFLAVIMMFVVGGAALFGSVIYLIYRALKPAPKGPRGPVMPVSLPFQGGPMAPPPPMPPMPPMPPRPGGPPVSPMGPSGPPHFSPPAPQPRGSEGSTPFQPYVAPAGITGGSPRPSPATVPGGPLPSGFSPPPLPHASLIVVAGPSVGATIPLDRPETVIGREPPAHVIVAASAVSFEHARILFAQGTLWLIDRHSKNGTYVNGQRIQQKALVNGDVVTIGPTSYRVVLS